MKFASATFGIGGGELPSMPPSLTTRLPLGVVLLSNYAIVSSPHVRPRAPQGIQL